MYQQSFRECLSEHDQKILESLFVSSEIGGVAPEVFKLVIDEDITDIPEQQTSEIKQSVKLEMEGIRQAEIGNLDEAILLFNNAIKVTPNRGSVYNNRAQTLRLKGNDQGALNDLIKAIDLSTHKHGIRCQALCQRGLLHRKMDNITAAKMDFEEAAKLGSKFAKAQLVEMNPYAALCNQMLQAAFAKML